MVIVLGIDANCKSNPLHVAVTRGTEKLIMVQNAFHPHPELKESQTNDLCNRGALKRFGKIEQSSKIYSPPSSQVVDITNWSPRMRFNTILSYVTTTTEKEGTPCVTQIPHTQCVYMAAVLQVLKQRYNSHQKLENYYRSMYVPSDALVSTVLRNPQQNITRQSTQCSLAVDLGYLFEKCHKKMRAGEVMHHRDWICLSSACKAWDNLHHTMRQTLPVDRWIDEGDFSVIVRDVITKLSAVIPLSGNKFDVFKSTQLKNAILYGRCDVVTANGEGIMFCASGEICSLDIFRAACCQTVHGIDCMVIVDLLSGGVVRAMVEDTSRFIESVEDVLCHQAT